jgi:hypothetical protein
MSGCNSSSNDEISGGSSAGENKRIRYGSPNKSDINNEMANLSVQKENEEGEDCEDSTPPVALLKSEEDTEGGRDDALLMTEEGEGDEAGGNDNIDKLVAAIRTHLVNLCCKKDLIIAAELIIRGGLTMNKMRFAIKYGLENSQLKVGETADSIKEAYKIFITMVGEEWIRAGYLPNMGDILSDDTLGAAMKNYNPEAYGFLDDLVRLHRIPEDNPCILAIKKYITRSVAKEAGQQATAKDIASIKVIDAISVVLKKDGYKKHFSKACTAADISKAEGYLISIIILGFYAKLYRIRNEGEGKLLPVIIPSANARDEMFDERVQQESFETVFSTVLIVMCGYVPHGECMVNKKYLLAFEEEELMEFGYRIACFLDSIFEFDLSSLTSSHSKVYLKFSGLLFMSDEEKEGLRKMRQKLIEQLLMMHEDVKMSIYDAFENGILTEEDMSPLYQRFEHVIKAAAASSKLEPDGSNIKSVYDEIDKIFSKGVPETTFKMRWSSFLERCKDQDGRLHSQLHRQRQMRAATEGRDQIRNDSSIIQQQKKMSFEMLKSSSINTNKKK